MRFYSEEERQPSTHLEREKKGKDDRLEELLIEWGEWRRDMIPGLGTGVQTPIAVAMELTKACKSSDMVQPKQTKCVKAVIPHYWIHRRMSKVNNVIWGLRVKYQEMLIRYYEDGWTTREFCEQRGWTKKTYYNRLSEARREIRSQSTIKGMLGRA